MIYQAEVNGLLGTDDLLNKFISSMYKLNKL